MTTTVTASSTSNPIQRIPRRVGADTRYLLLGFPLAVAGFVVLVTGFFAGVGLLVIAAGLPVLGLTLYAARGFADLERLRLRDASGGPPRQDRPTYRAADPRRVFFRRAMTPLSQGQSWLDLLHGVATFVLSTVTFVLTVTWWSLAAGGLTYWFWERFLPQGGDRVVVEAVLGSYSHTAEIALYTAFGLVALVTLPLVLRGLAALRSGFARTLLVDVAAYRAEQARTTITG